MRHLPLVFLLFFSLPAFSQFANLHINPFTEFDLSPRWRIGVEYDTQAAFAFSLDVGYGDYALNKFRINDLKWGAGYQFLEVRPEVKYFLAKNIDSPRRFFKSMYLRSAAGVSLYTGVELFYIRLDNTFKNDYYEQPDPGQDIAYNKATFHKRKVGAHVKYGIQYLIRKLVIDNSVGVGMAHRNRFYTDIVDAQVVTESFEPAESFNAGHRKAGKRLIYHLTFNMRLGFMFWQKKN